MELAQLSYWIDLFTWTTWQEFLEAGGTVSGFRESRWKTLQHVRAGDCLLCYLTGVSRFIAVLEVTTSAYKDASPIWRQEEFPCRVGVKIVHQLTPETAVPIITLKDQLSIFKAGNGSSSWTGFVRGSPNKWDTSDGEIVVQVIRDAVAHPILRPVDPKKLQHLPKALKSKLGPVTVPETDAEDLPQGLLSQPAKEPSAHTEIQWMLAKLGSDMGLDVWVAKNDKNKCHDGHAFTELKKFKSELQMNFEEAVNRTIELIDVLWLKGNSIQAAFEIESTTSVYSGLLRMSDLISMLPNLKIPLFIVAPDERREKVFTEVNRPTFSKLPTPMHEMCRFIAFSSLKAKVEQLGELTKYVKPEILDEIAEPCEADEG